MSTRFFWGRFAYWHRPHIPVWGWRDRHGDYRHVLDLGRFTYYPGGRIS